MSNYYLVSAAIIQLFFGNSWTLHSGSCDWLFALHPSLHPTETQPQPFILDSFTQCLPLYGNDLWCHIG